MANHKQAVKRNRQRIKHHERNQHQRTTMRSMAKKVHALVENKSIKEAKETLDKAISLLDKCGRKRVIPKNRAARTISRLTKAVNSLS